MTEHDIGCGTCGRDLTEPGAWVHCRAHYVAEIRSLRERLNSAGAELATVRAQLQVAVEALRKVLAATEWDTPDWECGHGMRVPECDDPECEPHLAWEAAQAAVRAIEGERSKEG